MELQSQEIGELQASGEIGDTEIGESIREFYTGQVIASTDEYVTVGKKCPAYEPLGGIPG
jgi:hypothetical protein